jgi:hypothetical protein
MLHKAVAENMLTSILTSSGKGFIRCIAVKWGIPLIKAYVGQVS